MWDEDRIVEEQDDVGAIDVAYTLEPAAYGNLISQSRDAAASYYHYNALGSTSDLTDSGEVVDDTYVYEAFGDSVATSGTTANPFRFVGEQGYYHDEETGRYTVRQRTYDSDTGRWLSEDPIRADEENLYRYVGNDPTNAVDPSGLQEACPAPTTFEATKVEPNPQNNVQPMRMDRIPTGRINWFFQNEGRRKQHHAEGYCIVNKKIKVNNKTPRVVVLPMVLGGRLRKAVFEKYDAFTRDQFSEYSSYDTRPANYFYRLVGDVAPSYPSSLAVETFVIDKQRTQAAEVSVHTPKIGLSLIGGICDTSRYVAAHGRTADFR